MKMGKELIAIANGYIATKDGDVISSWFSKQKFLKPKEHTGGYSRFQCYPKLGKPFDVYIHRFIWVFFNGPIGPGLQINHLDFNRKNNHLGNLELTTHFENVRHSVKAGHFRHNGKHSKGVGNGRSILSERDVLEIASRLENGEKASAIAFEYWVGRTAIRDIGTRRSWKHLWVTEEN